MATLSVTDMFFLTLVVYRLNVNPFPPVSKCDGMVPLRDVVSNSSPQGDMFLRSCGNFFYNTF